MSFFLSKVTSTPKKNHKERKITPQINSNNNNYNRNNKKNKIQNTQRQQRLYIFRVTYFVIFIENEEVIDHSWK